MIKKVRIPTLKADSYRRSYFKHQTPVAPSASSEEQYFEINNRCVWPNVIDAHRLEFYMIFIMTRGEGIYTFGPTELYIRENTLCFIGPDMIRSWRAQMDEQQGFFVNFSETFFSQGFMNRRMLHDFPFFQVGGHPVIQLSEIESQDYLTLFQWMKKEYDNRTEFSHAILRSYLHLLLHKANAHVKEEKPDTVYDNGAGIRLVKAFKALYMRDFNVLGEGKNIMLKQIAAYADELGVSQNHLNDTIKLITGRSAGRLIRHHLANHATMCLMHADKTVSEIAFALGFEDPSYFARFYKAQTGKSPSEFRSGENP